MNKSDYIRFMLEQANRTIKNKLELEMSERFLEKQKLIFEGLKGRVENIEDATGGFIIWNEEKQDYDEILVRKKV
jgi:hypothetical protein